MFPADRSTLDPPTFVMGIFLIALSIVVTLWMVSGFVGFFLLLVKGKLPGGGLLWLIFGWNIGLYVIALGGGFFLWHGLKAKGDQPCPWCREKIDRQAVVCPYCQSILWPVGSPPSFAPAPDMASPAGPTPSL